MHKIYYFSGTGNTLAAAKQVAAKLGNDVELLPIASLPRGCTVDFGVAETVGIFHPVYCFGVPALVQNFLERLKPLPKNAPQPYMCGNRSYPQMQLPAHQRRSAQQN